MSERSGIFDAQASSWRQRPGPSPPCKWNYRRYSSQPRNTHLKRRLLYPYLLISLILAVGDAIAAPGDLDATFTPETCGYITPSLNCFALSSDGKVLLGLSANSSALPRVNFQESRCISRLRTDGTIDTTFQLYSGSAAVYALCVSANGSIVAGGSFHLPDYATAGVMRFFPDGSVDSSFQLIKGINSVAAVCELSNGKLLIGGEFNADGAQQHRNLARLNAGGSLDESFQTGLGFDGKVSIIKVQSDGKVLAAGSFTTFDGAAANRIIRLNPDGSRDASFQTGTVFNSSAAMITGVETQADGRIVVSGRFFNVGTPYLASLVRLHPGGSLDTGFQPVDQFDYVNSIAIDQNGKIIAGADLRSGPLDIAIIRYQPDGTRDPEFNPAPVPYLPPTQIIPFDGAIYFGGLQTLGSLDSTGQRTAFFQQTGPSDSVEDIIALPSGNILIQGRFYYYNGTLVRGLAELSSDGSVAKIFSELPSLGDYTNGKAAVQSDGKLLFLTDLVIRRFRVDGSLDPTFAYSSLRLGQAIAVQSDGRVLVGFYPQNLQDGLIRLLPDGTTDSSFNPAAAQNGRSVKLIKIQGDGKILIGGGGFPISASTYRRLIRLNQDGSLDSTFLFGYPDMPDIRDIQILPDGKILIAGKLDDGQYPTYASSRVARLLPDGNIDSSFIPCLPSATEVFRIAAQPDGKILIAGNFRDVNGVERSGIARLDSDGSFDSTFDPASGIDGVITGDPRAFAVALDMSGKILLGGNFLTFAGTPHSFLVRLNSDGSHHAPVHAFSKSIVADEDSAPSQFTVSVSDPDGDAPTWSSIGSIGSITVTGATPNQIASFSPIANKNGTERIALISRDPQGHADVTLIPVSLRAVNDPPVATQRPTFTAAPVSTRNTAIAIGIWNDLADTSVSNLSYTFRWEVANNTNGSGATPIPGANQPQVTPDLALAGKYLRAVVTAADSGIGTPTSQSTTESTDWELILAPLSYQDWKLQHFGAGAPMVSAPGADPDGDGANNLEEYSLNMNPRLSDAQYLPYLTTETRNEVNGPATYLVLNYRNAPNAVDARITGQISEILSNWQSDGPWQLFSKSRIKNPDGSETISLRDLQPMTYFSRRFLRLLIEMP
jgi:uncharacterized delta-60 repeat protein